jgi:hypothetical protein
MNPKVTDVKIHTTKDDVAPAFNIFDVGLLGSSTVRKLVGESPPKLTWKWTSGQQGDCGLPMTCYFKPPSDTISVLSLDSNRDEYDDLVLLHEYGHFFLHHYSADNSPGGPHRFSRRYDPRLAWAEGSATFFGAYAKGTSLLLDTDSTGVRIRVDIETLEILGGSVPLGTDSGTQTGNLSEVVVAGILWDLADATNETPNGANGPADTVTNPDAVFSSMTAMHSINPGDKTDRNPVGADLVDFLDEWYLLGNDSTGDSNTGVMGIVNGLFEFPYDYAFDLF